jgi:dihydroorotase
MPAYDLLIKHGTLLDPGQGVHARQDLALGNGLVAAVADDIPASQATEVLDASGLLVTPGLIDVHTHVYYGVSHYGLEPDSTSLAKGVTTVLDTGSAGAQTFQAFRRFIIDVAATRVLALLNVSVMGMLYEQVGELLDLRYVDNALTLRVARDNPGVVVGLKLRMAERMVGPNGPRALELAREAADALGAPLMIHIGDSLVSLETILDALRAGDIVTHAYHGLSEGILDQQGRIKPAVRAAAERGVRFDVGHGRGSFSWRVAEQALAEGFLPGTISSDLHTHNLDGPVFDLPTTLSKFLHLGLSLEETLSRCTNRAAPVLGAGLADRIGSLRPGLEADVALFALEEGRFDLVDAHGETLVGQHKLVPRGVVRGGRVITGPRLSA